MHLCDRTLLPGHEKECDLAIRDNTDGPRGHCAEISQTRKDRRRVISLTVASKEQSRQINKTESSQRQGTSRWSPREGDAGGPGGRGEGTARTSRRPRSGCGARHRAHVGSTETAVVSGGAEADPGGHSASYTDV